MTIVSKTIAPIWVTKEIYAFLLEYTCNKEPKGRQLLSWEKERIIRTLQNYPTNEEGLIMYTGQGGISVTEAKRVLDSQHIPYKIGEKVKTKTIKEL